MNWKISLFIFLFVLAPVAHGQLELAEQMMAVPAMILLCIPAFCISCLSCIPLSAISCFLSAFASIPVAMFSGIFSGVIGLALWAVLGFMICGISGFIPPFCLNCCASCICLCIINLCCGAEIAWCSTWWLSNLIFYLLYMTWFSIGGFGIGIMVYAFVFTTILLFIMCGGAFIAAWPCCNICIDMLLCGISLCIFEWLSFLWTYFIDLFLYTIMPLLYVVLDIAGLFDIPLGFASSIIALPFDIIELLSGLIWLITDTIILLPITCCMIPVGICSCLCICPLCTMVFPLIELFISLIIGVISMLILGPILGAVCACIGTCTGCVLFPPCGGCTCCISSYMISCILFCISGLVFSCCMPQIGILAYIAVYTGEEEACLGTVEAFGGAFYGLTSDVISTVLNYSIQLSSFCIGHLEALSKFCDFFLLPSQICVCLPITMMFFPNLIKNLAECSSGGCEILMHTSKEFRGVLDEY